MLIDNLVKLTLSQLFPLTEMSRHGLGLGWWYF